jgi:hypothetical protein
MRLDDEVKIIFKTENGNTAAITITVNQLLESKKDDLYEMLEETIPCTCNINECCNHCDCNLNFEDYVIAEVMAS